MPNNKQEKNIIIVSVLAGVAMIMFWFFYNPVSDFAESVPGMDNRPDSISGNQENVQIGKDFEKYADEESGLTGKWTNFRGADFDNIVKDNIPLIDKFPNDGPNILWKVELGEGHAAPAIYNGKVYILDYIEKEKADALRCFSLISGKELWQRKYKVHIKRNHGMSRTVPAVNDSCIVTIGPKGHVMCSNPETGDLLWSINLVKAYGTEIPFWYTGQCPFIDNNKVIIAPGNKALLVAVDCITGKVVWETPNPDKWQMSHSSVMPMSFKGKKMYVYAAIGGICGISAGGDDAGQILWKLKDFAPNVVAPSPVIINDEKIFMTAGYGAGSVLFKLNDVNGKFEPEILQMFKPKEGVASEQQSAIIYKDHLFAILPKDAGARRNQFVCCKPDDCKNILWTSGKTNRFGLGPYIVADNKFFILNDNGTLTIAKATTDKFQFLDKKRILEGHDAWGPIAIADGKLLMRDSKTMVCIDVEKK